MTKKDDVLKIRLPADLKAAAMAASAEKRGGLSQVIRELLAAWLQSRKKSPARRG
jgi:hypothetical protein